MKGSITIYVADDNGLLIQAKAEYAPYIDSMTTHDIDVAKPAIEKMLKEIQSHSLTEMQIKSLNLQP